MGSYSYPSPGAGSVRPHAVTAIAGTVNGLTNPAFSYDARGNLTSGAGRSFTWTSFDLPARISQGTTNLDFTYGPEHQRLRQVSPTATTIYLASPHYEKETQAGGLILHKHYLHAGGRLIGLYTQRSTGQNDTRYFVSDHLGSVSVVTDEAGNVTERLSFDAWGKRRSPNGTADPGNVLRPGIDRGYTGHEHLDEAGIGLIHMNGRVYDPAIGRFTAPDPLVQAPGFSQSLNRYSYVWNNPMRFVDPSGWEIITRGFGTYGGGLVWFWLDTELAPTLAPGYMGSHQLGELSSDQELATATGSLNGPASTGPTLSNYSTGGSGGLILNQSMSLPGGGSTSGSSTITSSTTSSGGGSFSSTNTYTSSNGGAGCTANSCSGITVGGIGNGQTGGTTGGNSSGVSTTTNGTFAAAVTPVVGSQNEKLVSLDGVSAGVSPFWSEDSRLDRCPTTEVRLMSVATSPEAVAA